MAAGQEVWCYYELSLKCSWATRSTLLLQCARRRYAPAPSEGWLLGFLAVFWFSDTPPLHFGMPTLMHSGCCTRLSRSTSLNALVSPMSSFSSWGEAFSKKSLPGSGRGRQSVLDTGSNQARDFRRPFARVYQLLSFPREVDNHSELIGYSRS